MDIRVELSKCTANLEQFAGRHCFSTDSAIVPRRLLVESNLTNNSH